MSARTRFSRAAPGARSGSAISSLRIVRPASEDGAAAGPSQQGDGGPSDTFEEDEELADDWRTENSLPDVPGDDEDEDIDGGGLDNDESEETGGQDMPMPRSATPRAPSGPTDTWSYRNKPKPIIPAHMYTAPRYRPGGEEGDDTMDAADYVTALNGHDAPGMGGFSDFLKDVGKTVGVTVLNDATRALGGTPPGALPAKVIVPPPPPMSTAAKIGIAVAIGIPVLYFLTRSRSVAAAPLVAHNPRRRRRRRR